ncbi:MAG TPA: bifunctional hydroxymethylpyrimidine kinase/phosphomethylpyrimidine kinase [Acidimicrobiales bacterium]|nr:bifunctional hydroxymethylpyrimidine kinase/phosphomethylpyrimidine kinase [Acidimicrobiales bacterium]
MHPPVALTVAGSDSGAGAGLQADLKAFAALGVFGTSVVTAVTAQNTAAVVAVEPMAPDLVDLQLEAVLSDLPVAAVKTGMLGSSATVAAVARWAEVGRLPNLVVDPVLASSTGRPLLDDAAVGLYLDSLFPYATLVTPNLREARLLTGLEIHDVDDMVTAAHRLAATGTGAVLVKGGHLGGARSPDVLLAAGTVRVLEAERVETGNDHGTGCTLSAAIAAGLAGGASLDEAVDRAKLYVTRSLLGASRWRLGAGRGPLDHFAWGDGGN